MLHYSTCLFENEKYYEIIFTAVSYTHLRAHET